MKFAPMELLPRRDFNNLGIRPPASFDHLTSEPVRRFRVLPGQVSDADIVPRGDEDIYILTHVILDSYSTAYSNSVLLALWQLGPRGSDSASSQAEPRRLPGRVGAGLLTEDFLREHPWASWWLPVGSQKSRQAADASSSQTPSLPVSLLTADERDVVLANLERKREEWREAYSPEEKPIDFTTSILGGSWTEVNKGVSTDNAVAFATNAEARAFLKKRGISNAGSAKFSLSLYGEQWAAAMSWYWCLRCQHS